MKFCRDRPPFISLSSHVEEGLLPYFSNTVVKCSYSEPVVYNMNTLINLKVPSSKASAHIFSLAMCKSLILGTGGDQAASEERKLSLNVKFLCTS